MKNTLINIAGAGAYAACLFYGVLLWTQRITGTGFRDWFHTTGTAPFVPVVNEGRGTKGRFAPRVDLLLLCAISLCLLLLPAGRLPARVHIPWALGVLGAVAACGAWVFLPWLGRGTEKSPRWVTAYWFLFLTGGAVLAFFALMRGLPGEIAQVDSFVATPLWSMASWVGTAGLCCLLAGAAGGLPSVRPARALASCRVYYGYTYLLWVVLVHGIVISLLVPWHLSVFFDLGLIPGLIVDALGFWAKVAMSVAVASWGMWNAPWMQRAALGLLCAGQALLVLDALWVV